MDKAKAAVSDFMSKSGHHDTTVHESVAPHVTNETINEQRREERQVAVDKEIHQDHYHTSVQPVQHQEVLKEQHHHNLIPVEHRTHDHRDHEHTKQQVQTEAAQFKDTSVRSPAQHTSVAAPSVAGEHVHHHVHETIQPVVHKETIEPHVTHTTVPIHEVHHNSAQHHAASALPAVSMADFKKQGGSLTGRDERVDQFSGEPKNIDRTLGNAMSHTGAGQHSSLAHDDQRTGGLGHEGRTGHHAGGIGQESRSGQHTGAIGQDSRTGQHTGALGQDSRTGNTTGTSSGLGNTTSTGSGHGADNGAAPKKASLMDKLNPKVDSNGDGKAGFMK